jgi:hypothetical protein
MHDATSNNPRLCFIVKPLKSPLVLANKRRLLVPRLQNVHPFLKRSDCVYVCVCVCVCVKGGEFLMKASLCNINPIAIAMTIGRNE